MDSNAISEANNFVLKAYQWKYEKQINLISVQKIKYSINWSFPIHKIKDSLITDINNDNFDTEKGKKVYERIVSFPNKDKINNKNKFSITNENSELLGLEEIFDELETFLNNNAEGIDSQQYNQILKSVRFLEENFRNISNDKNQQQTKILNLYCNLLEKQLNILDSINAKYLNN